MLSKGFIRDSAGEIGQKDGGEIRKFPKER
jgi:hypothetical protein